MKRRGAGHPVTTNSAAMPVVSFRLSERDHDALVNLARNYGNTSNGLAKFFVIEGIAKAIGRPGGARKLDRSNGKASPARK